VVIVLRACSLVDESLAMLLSELPGRRSGIARRFTLRRSGQAVYLRSRSSDLRVFHEVLYYRAYDLPERARHALSEHRAAIDAGAHIGLFTLFLCESVPGATVTAFEPDPENAHIARLTLAPLIRAGQVELVEAAVGTRERQIPFVTRMGMTSRRAAPGESRATPVRQIDLLDQLDGVGLLKLDIEGAEWDILRDPRWSVRQPACLVMEWHALHDDHREQDPVGQLTRLLAGADEVEHTPFAPGLVGHLWAFR
jgi:FkbM family methyltransferase